MKVAYICEPQVGGTYTSFRQVRERLRDYGIDYRCIPPVDGKTFSHTPFVHDDGVDFIDFPSHEPRDMALRLVQHLVVENYSIVVILPGCYPFVSSLPPYLPRTIRCIARMPHNARGVYWPTALMADHFQRILAVGPRLRYDLTTKYGVSASRVDVIANGVDTDHFLPGNSATAHRAIYVGRLEDVQKNVFLLPKILLRALEHDNQAFMTIVGSGPDSDRLANRFHDAGLDGHYEMMGRLDAKEIPSVLRSHGVFLLPSRFEGCSNSTLEAMACGCVPLLSRLEGISDFLVDHGRSGFLCALGDGSAMGDTWGQLIREKSLWLNIRGEARRKVESQFSLNGMADKYAHLFHDVLDESPDCPEALPMSEFLLHPGMGPTWRRWIPKSVKKCLRTLAARIGFSP